MDSSRLEQLWSSSLAGDTLTLAEENELATGMADTGELRDRLLRDGELHAAIGTLVRCQRTEYRFVGKVIDRLEAPETAAPQANGHHQTNGHVLPMRSRFQAAVDPGPVELLPEPSGSKRTLRRRLPLLVALAAAASILIALGLLYGLWPGDDQGPPDAPPPMVKNTLPNLKPLEHVARLTQSADCEWQGQKPEGRVAVGPVRLTRGKATFEFDDGAVVELQAPADFSLVSAGKGELHRGGLRALVPPKAVGFRIETPSAIIVDRGTEFTVTVDADGVTQVKVIKGQVDVFERLAEGKTIQRGPLGIGQSLRIEPAAKPAPAPGKGFREILLIEGEPREFTDREAYEKALRELREKERPKETEQSGEFVGPPEGPVEPARKPVVEEPARPADKKPHELRGTVEINGRKTPFTSLQEFDRGCVDPFEVLRGIAQARQGLFQTPVMAPGNFKAVIVINGEVHQFDKPDAFEKFRQKMRKEFGNK